MDGVHDGMRSAVYSRVSLSLSLSLVVPSRAHLAREAIHSSRRSTDDEDVGTKSNLALERAFDSRRRQRSSKTVVELTADRPDTAIATSERVRRATVARRRPRLADEDGSTTAVVDPSIPYRSQSSLRPPLSPAPTERTQLLYSTP